MWKKWEKICFQPFCPYAKYHSIHESRKSENIIKVGKYDKIVGK